MEEIIQKWLQTPKEIKRLQELAAAAPDSSISLKIRLKWVTKFVDWIRTGGPSAKSLTASDGGLQAARLRFALHVLDQNPEIKLTTAKTLRSVIKDTRALEMFLNVGIPNQMGFFGEALERIQLMMLPEAHNEYDLTYVFSQTFKHESDAAWLKKMDTELFKGWVSLLHFGEENDLEAWNRLNKDVADALFLTTLNARALGLSHFVRSRIKATHFSELPFYALNEFSGNLLNATETTARVEAYLKLSKQIETCRAITDEILDHFKEEGVSVSMVYEVERLRALLSRINVLGRLIAGQEFGVGFIQDFVVSLIEENLKSRSFTSLLADNLNLLSKKVVETNAEMGEHYITRNYKEFRSILKKALGGGLITSLTVVLKFWITQFKLPPAIMGFFASINFSASFILIQAFGFTLATKQPAMTATVLAQKLQNAKNSAESAASEIVNLIRSQIAAVFGNLFAVVPAIIVVFYVCASREITIIDSDYAYKTLSDHSVFGITPFYAAWTGVLLWVSSVFAGAFSNWLSFRQLPKAFTQSSRFIQFFGEKRAHKFNLFLQKVSGGVAANVSLGILLGMSPQIAQFFGLPLDVRHVTLVTGAITLSAFQIGASVLYDPVFWKAVAAIAVIGTLNLGVSFSLALFVALRARQSFGIRGRQIYRHLMRRLTTNPRSFFLPPSA